MAPDVRSCGFVVVRRLGDRLVYLTLRNAHHGTVGVPKGGVEPGEDPLDAAYRETAEETGLDRAALKVRPPFRRTIRYPVEAGRKEVCYLLAETDRGSIRLSSEHSEARWEELAPALALIAHQDLRRVVRDAAVFLRDPALRRDLAPGAARALLERRMGDQEHVVRHSALVAGHARTLAESGGAAAPDATEAMAWLHDIGRSVTHGPRHPLEGFRIVVAEGHPGYAAACITHATKGASAGELLGDEGADEALVREMAGLVDLAALPPDERLIALADFLAIGDRPATIEERLADIEHRYGPSGYFRRNAALAERYRAEYEERTGRGVYALLGIR